MYDPEDWARDGTGWGYCAEPKSAYETLAAQLDDVRPSEQDVLSDQLGDVQPNEQDVLSDQLGDVQPNAQDVLDEQVRFFILSFFASARSTSSRPLSASSLPLPPRDCVAPSTILTPTTLLTPDPPRAFLLACKLFFIHALYLFV